MLINTEYEFIKLADELRKLKIEKIITKLNYRKIILQSPKLNFLSAQISYKKKVYLLKVLEIGF